MNNSRTIYLRDNQSNLVNGGAKNRRMSTQSTQNRVDFGKSKRFMPATKKFQQKAIAIENRNRKPNRIIIEDSEYSYTSADSDYDEYSDEIYIDLADEELEKELNKSTTYRLGDGPKYKGKVTAWTKSEVIKRLEGYRRVKDINKVSPGVHLRYFKIEKDGDSTFKPGGLLVINRKNDPYVVLKGGKRTWSVQKRVIPESGKYEGIPVATIFYRKIQETERQNIKLQKALIKKSIELKKAQKAEKELYNNKVIRKNIDYKPDRTKIKRSNKGDIIIA